MQAALPALPIPEAQTVAVAVVCLLAGIAVPTRYGLERIEGFGRSIASKLPYSPPPGMEEQEAMERAVRGRGSTGDQSGDRPADSQQGQPDDGPTGRTREA